jgi:hypothetical protein
MISRLRVTDLTARQPDLFVEPVTAPLFVAGMPRSGTTFLHRTMARDRAWYSMPFWEAMEPIPAVGTLCGSGPDPRVRTGEGILRFTRWVMPEMAGVHEIENDEPEEELSILAAGHASITFGLGYFPAYARWYTTTDHTGGYRLLRQFIQAMQASRPAGGRWLLKCPSHLEMLCPLLTVFNDAKVVLTHRDPISSIVSLAALAYFTVGISFRRPDPHWFGQTSANFIERALHSMVHYRDSDEGIENGDRFIDVAFTELVSNPIGAVHRISLAAGREPDDAALAAMRAYTGRPSGHRSEQRFTVEDFGLDKMALRERFKFYYERFEVPIERG